MTGAIPDYEESHLIWRYQLTLIPLNVILASLVWVLHDYFITLEDEIRYIWRQKSAFRKFMFLWIRYYTIFLLAFDAFQTHYLDEHEISNSNRALCVLVDPTDRIAGAIGLWSIEIVMQWRIYVLFKRSKKVAIANGILFVASMFLFIYIMVVNAIIRNKAVPNTAILGEIGCPSQIGGSDWALWVPATVFEVIIFLLALYICATGANGTEENKRPSLISVLISENVLHFFFVASLLLFYVLMVAEVTPIPWFGSGPFHAATGIVTCRVLISLQKYSIKSMEKGKSPQSARASLDSLSFDGSADSCDEETLDGERNPSNIYDLERGPP